MNQKLLITGALFGALFLPCAAYPEALHSQPAKSPNDGDVSRWLTPMQMLIVTPTRIPQPLDQTIADTTVLTQQDIRNSGAPDVPTLLRSLTGVEIVQTGGLGSQSSIFMRGTNSNQVLVLLDGVRINSATTGSTALEHIMLDNVERIEVVRGNVSSLYGSGAIGGVIQIFTKQGHGAPAFNASAGIGTHRTQRVSAGFSGVMDKTTFSLDAGHVKTDGVSSINPILVPAANPNNNGYDNNTFNARVKYDFDVDHALSAALFTTRGNTSFDSAYGSPTDINNTIENIGKLSVASDDQLNEKWHSQIRLAQGVDDSHTYLNGAPNYRYRTQSNQFTWQNNFKVADGQQLNLAAEYLGQAVDSDTLYTQTTRHEKSVLGGYTGVYGTHQVQLNLRQDNYSDFGTANTGLLGYGVSFEDSWRATVSISNAFKAPTFNDMYYPLSYGYQGNPNLKPERSKNKEIGLHYAANRQLVDAVYFDNHISDLIAVNAAYTTVVNINQAKITGEELSYAGEFGDIHLTANLTWQNPRDTETGQVLQRRAREFGSFSAARSFGAWNAGAEVRYSGARPDIDYSSGNSIMLQAYQLFNLTAGYRIDKDFRMSLRVDNLFNRDYSEAYTYNTLGRTLFVGLNYQQ